jgi:glycosyltransferase involved in cell wall biosynthesis
VFCFPSYREGLPNAPLEAALAGLPIVGFRATGTVDVVRDGETGFLVEIGNIDALTSALERVLHDEDLRRQLGLAGQRWVLENFPPKVVWQQLHALYDELLPEH